MTLREILQNMVDEGDMAKLSNGNGAMDPAVLLETLSEPMLKTPAYIQAGLYIAQMDENGYLGRVLFRFEDQD